VSSPDMIRYPHLSIEESCEHQSTRVCIATYEILGTSQNGGIGTAYFSLATTLASAGHDVTILYFPSERSDQTAIEHWITHFRTLGIRFVALPHAQRTIKVPQFMLTSRDAYTWLQKQQFDVTHLPELQGHGYYSVLAKHQGLDFSPLQPARESHSQNTAHSATVAERPLPSFQPRVRECVPRHAKATTGLFPRKSSSLKPLRNKTPLCYCCKKSKSID
jgi:hypothetical protein